MEIDYSLLSANHLQLKSNLDNLKNEFKNIHFDLIDHNFENNLGLSTLTLDQLIEIDEFEISLHLMTENPFLILNKYEGYEFSSITVHVETVNLNMFKKIAADFKNVGVGIAPYSDILSLNNYLPYSNHVLLLCTQPSISKYETINTVERTREFKILFPDYEKIIIDGGILKDQIKILESMNVDTIVLGKLLNSI